VAAVTKDPAGAYLEIHCSEHLFKPASISYSSRGLVFSCQLGPFSPSEMADLDEAARTHRGLRIVFPASELLLSRIQIEPVAPEWARIEGFVERAR
jgi:hypothetical protein